MEITIKEDNYVSVVAVVRNMENSIEEKMKKLDETLSVNFLHYEIVMVDNFSTDKTLLKLSELNKKITIIELSRPHNLQQALMAGVDISIGDFIIEIDNISYIEDFSIIMDLYHTSLEGYDFVFYSPKKIPLGSRLFYKLINNYYKSKFNSDINSALIVLSSRRGQNKVSETGSIVVNRSISYVLSGLNYKTLLSDVKYINHRGFMENLDLMFETLINHTNLIPKVATGISLLFFIISLGFLFYSIFIFTTIGAIVGWTSITMILSFSFCGVFLMFAVALKYLFSILNVTKKAKPYSYRSVIKK